MLTSLFSIFDPSLSFLGLSFFTPFFIFLFFWMGVWSSSFVFIFYSSAFNFINKEISFSFSSPVVGVYKFFSFVFFSIFLFNFLSMFPYFFAYTSHLMFTLPVSFSLWLLVIFFVIYNYFYSFLSHLIPVGTPTMLISFMVIVEIVSNLIRPVALMFRLTANMMAGHLLMSLIGSSFVGSSVTLVFFGGALSSLLVFMEIGVSVIQSYVFFVLLMLYMTEVSH